MCVVGINCIGTRHSGAAQIVLDLIDGLVQLTEIETIVAFSTGENQRRFKFPPIDKLCVVDVPAITNNAIIRFIWLQVAFRRLVQRYSCDVVFNMNNVAGVVPVPQVLFVQQSLYFSREALRAYAKNDSGNGVRFRMHLEHRVMKCFYKISSINAKAVVVQTDLMKRCLVEQLGIRPDKITVVRPAAPKMASHMQPERRFSPEFRHWLYVGNNCPYKNIETIYKAAEISRKKECRWVFHIVGFKDPLVKADLPIVFHGFLHHEQLSSLYRLADALILPSLTETVGLPMLEALSFGTPVVCADRPYAHEICERRAVFFDPFSAESLVEKLSNLTPLTNQERVSHKNWVRMKYGRDDNALQIWGILRNSL